MQSKKWKYHIFSYFRCSLNFVLRLISSIHINYRDTPKDTSKLKGLFFLGSIIWNSLHILEFSIMIAKICFSSLLVGCRSLKLLKLFTMHLYFFADRRGMVNSTTDGVTCFWDFSYRFQLTICFSVSTSFM